MSEPRESPSSREFHNSSVRVSVAFGAGVVVAGATLAAGGGRYAAAFGWDVAAATLLALTWLRVGPMDSETTRRHATQEDSTRHTTDLLLATASIASLLSVLLLLVRAASMDGADKIWTIVLGLATIVLSWFVVHTVFALDYARLYYTDPVGGIDFNQREDPSYGDFAYVAFVLGMTYQVSDTNVGSHRIRMAMLRQSLLSYLFGTFVLAASVNLFVTLAS
ncbi:DUF1345 domain-containing protein [Rhodococcus sp. HNM0569]|uniref:DUF1345 domain-containing protein n=1 Tax=Rhodococcus sp. HNM0569 TaxID=2716340 RepID=UPI00146C79C7|nr:DUF1345 domain-containing protein [Rhodococcus sp. HNM0569]